MICRMRCLVVGCGSIGSRRARLLAEMGHSLDVYDPDEDAMREAIKRLLLLFHRLPRVRPRWTADKAEALSWQADAVFVCTPANTHLAVAREITQAGCRGLFVEKPLSVSMDGIAELVEECAKRGIVTMGGCNMRWAYSDVDLRRPSTGEVDFVVCKPLAAWRPGAEETYRPNGIVLEAAIHEMDVATSRLGPIIGLNAIGCDDECIIGIEHAGGAKSNIFAEWGPTARTGRWVTARDRFEPIISDEMYRQEMAHFLDCVANGTATVNPIANAAETLNWALRARDLLGSPA